MKARFAAALQTATTYMPGGNKILRDYKFDKSAGPRCTGGIADTAWHIYDAVHQKTQQHVSLHILDKDSLPEALKAEPFYQLLRHAATMQAKLRHPQVLRVVETLDESRKSFVLVTERVAASLTNLLDASTDESKLSSLDVKNGLRQVAEVMGFLHHDAHVYHNHLEPCNIFVTPEGVWKLAGFYHAVQTTAQGTLASATFDHSAAGPNFLPMLPSFTYVAPEMTKGSGTYDHRADIFSLGKLAYECHRHLAQKSRITPMKDTIAYEAHIRGLARLDYGGIPDALAQPLRTLLSQDPNHRPTLMQFLSGDYFNDMTVRTLRYLDTLLEKDFAARVEFLKRLPQAMDMFDARTACGKVLPPLLLQLQDEATAVFAMPTVLTIATHLAPTEFKRILAPALVREMAPGRPPQITHALLTKVALLMEKMDEADQREHVLPMVVRCLESSNSHMQQTALKEIVAVAKGKNLKYTTLKTYLLPRIAALVSGPEAPLSVRVNGLICFSQIFTMFDTDTIQETVVTSVEQCLVVAGGAPAVIMCSVGVLDNVSKALGLQCTAQRILPRLTPLLVSPALNGKQFDTVYQVIQGMLGRIQKQRSETLAKRDLVREAAKDQSRILANKDKGDVFAKAAGEKSFHSLVSGDENPLAPSSGGISGLASNGSSAVASDGGLLEGLSLKAAPATVDTSGGLFAGLKTKSPVAASFDPMGMGAATTTTTVDTGASFGIHRKKKKAKPVETSGFDMLSMMSNSPSSGTGDLFAGMTTTAPAVAASKGGDLFSAMSMGASATPAPKPAAGASLDPFAGL